MADTAAPGVDNEGQPHDAATTDAVTPHVLHGRVDAGPPAMSRRCWDEPALGHDNRRRAECMAHIQSDAVQLALDLLVREPDVAGFFRVFIKRWSRKPRATPAACGC